MSNVSIYVDGKIVGAFHCVGEAEVHFDEPEDLISSFRSADIDEIEQLKEQRDEWAGKALTLNRETKKLKAELLAANMKVAGFEAGRGHRNLIEIDALKKECYWWKSQAVDRCMSLDDRNELFSSTVVEKLGWISNWKDKLYSAAEKEGY